VITHYLPVLRQGHPASRLLRADHAPLIAKPRLPPPPQPPLAGTARPQPGKARHLPFGKALQDYAGTRNRQHLLSLLTPVQRAAEACAWLKSMVDAGEIYHPPRWCPPQAMPLLRPGPSANNPPRGHDGQTGAPGSKAPQASGQVSMAVTTT
jgi:non-specific serine/threonine protein kinase